jgi:dipeptidyl aminopeptidase/acylaminoacyl peptidase
MIPRRQASICTPLVFLLALSSAAAQPAYRKPPKEILEILDVPAPPRALPSPTGDQLLLVEEKQYPSISDLAQPMLRLAGLRINPRTNGLHRPSRMKGLSLVRIADGSTRKVGLPAASAFDDPVWSADGSRICLRNTVSNGIELWVLETATARLRKLGGIVLNAAFGNAAQWMPDQKSLLVQTVPSGRRGPPSEPDVPKGPNIQENYGKEAPVWTFEDLLKNVHDEDLFDYYATAQLGIVDTSSGKWRPVGAPGVFQSVEPSPDGKLLLVTRLHRPYSYLVIASSFPKEIEVWDVTGKPVFTVASQPLQEQVRTDGVPTGPRNCRWRPAEPSTLVWVEALDKGDPRAKVPHRDRVLQLRAPFNGTPQELARTEFRFAGLQWSEKNSVALLSESDRPTRRTRAWLVSADDAAAAPSKIWDRNSQDRYGDPGSPVTRQLPDGQRVLLQSGNSVLLEGNGSSPDGDRPFLDQFDLRTMKSRRLFQCSPKTYERVLGVLDQEGTRFLTRYETPAEPPNIYVRSSDGSERRALTQYVDRASQLRGIQKELVKYKRRDGVDLSFTLYLPPGYRKGERLPTVVWAYPLEYTDPAVAGQVSGSPYRYTTISGTSHLFFLTQGYAILDGASMPVIGDPETVNNTYIDQIVESARAAIDRAAEMGVTDPDRVGIGGHSYGAFMTANLLSHCDLFRAGIARSGAYNRTLTPFGFQSERRTLWEATEVYMKMSPFLFAHKIDEPILLIHGEADNNSGTFPIQSERYYHALKGNGKTVRYVTLPLESHGYAARESIEHTLYEMIAWFERHVKNAPPREKRAS